MVFDTFLFFDEFDVLDIRLRELWDVVDCFVIGEATKTFSGKDKPLRFKEYGGFGSDSEKIRYVVMDDFTGAPSEPHEMDRWQKSRVLDALHDAQPDDLVIYADCDEIVKAGVVRQVADSGEPGDVIFEAMLETYYYWLNCVRCNGVQSRGAKICKWKTLKKVGAENIRRLRVAPRIYNAGWHLSFMSPDIQGKLDAYAHQEYNQPPYNGSTHIENCRTNATDLFGRPKSLRFTHSLSGLPECVQGYPERYAHLIKAQPPVTSELPQAMKASSHQPVLEAAMEVFDIKFALELGTGHFSIEKLLRAEVLWSVEQDPVWLFRVSQDFEAANWRTILHYNTAIPVSRAAYFPPSKLPVTLRRELELYYQSLRGDVDGQLGPKLLFVDNFQCCRKLALEILAPVFDVVVLHDSEPEHHETYECRDWVPHGWESFTCFLPKPSTTCAWRPDLEDAGQFVSALDKASSRYCLKYLGQHEPLD